MREKSETKPNKSPPPAMAPGRPESAWTALSAGVLGAVLGLALLKFGNPVILDRLIDAPQGFWEFVFQPWPVRWGYWLLMGAVLLAVANFRRGSVGSHWVWLPLAWFGWQCLAALTTVDPELTAATLFQFGACLLCFGIGLWGLRDPGARDWFWLPILLGLGWVLWMGFEQHYGGLEATRKMFFARPDWQQFPAEYIKKIRSNRIFSTLVYPNALAGAILLYLPSLLVFLWRMSARLSRLTRGVLVGVCLYGGLACLFWSGSKSGWLIGMLQLLALVLRQPLSRRVRWAIIGVVLALGLAAFFVKFSAYFQRGAPSVSARFEYWRAGLRTALAHPIQGTGPGTFSIAYRRIKPPEAEMAQLVHNDYLEQASDSGWPGAVLYATFIVGSLIWLGRAPAVRERWEAFAVWLGLLAWSAQSLVEFPLYIPALAWPAFTFWGWLWAEAKPKRAALSGAPSGS